MALDEAHDWMGIGRSLIPIFNPWDGRVEMNETKGFILLISTDIFSYSSSFFKIFVVLLRMVKF